MEKKLKSPKSSANLQLPNSPFRFSTGAATQDKAIRIAAVFSDQNGKSMAGSLGLPKQSPKIEKIIKAQMFRGERGEILNQTSDGFLLLGLGEKKFFHPDVAASIFRKLGSLLIQKKSLKFELYFSTAIQEATETFSTMAAEPDQSRLKLAKAPTSVATQSKNAEHKDESTSAELIPDYFFTADWTELISQSVSCLMIGADSMNLLKKERLAKDNGKDTCPEIKILAANVPAKPLKEAVYRGEILGRMTNGARFMASLPGNYMNPESCEHYARAIAKLCNLKIQVFQAPQLEKLGCGGLLAVGQGSIVPPRMIVLEYNPTKASTAKKVVLVGKGVTFDTGGISIKPSAQMHEMKYDMCGSATALHGIALAAMRKLPIRTVAVIGFAENMPDGAAVKPGDVYQAYNGLNVEVQNTDAEGRLVLGDLLSYASNKYKPSYMIDFATLTGACVIALGHDAAGVMSSSDELAKRMDTASQKSLDRSWRMPHWSMYGEGLKSDIADLRNIAGRAGGSLSAMRFLARFVPAHIKWAHVDIAGVAWRDKAHGSQSKGATGWGIRMLNQFFEDLL